ncbi:hypothetical protein [Vibrio phage JSF12]|uniref:Uncharacterized protein n=2 Tax=Jesfedecavirus TaxID=2560156 RepID=A0A2D0YLP7_9CAUD|nr:hypothetical protein FDI98_gp133 [Vibrio phage JSF10]YP_009794713.1 hypothetical protein HOS35_gp030 [Vibrio phage JSF12]ASV43399.1 hypothetical protein [Vibrio phage JSF10]ASV43548.1 hypothetical protein [Vibrio phage JSF12]
MNTCKKAPCRYCDGTVWILEDEACCHNCGEEYSPDEFNEDGTRNVDPD